MVLCVVAIPISWLSIVWMDNIHWILCVRMRRCNKCDTLRLSLFSFYSAVLVMIGYSWCVWSHVDVCVCKCVHLCLCLSECNQYLFASVGTKIVSVKKFKAAHDINKDLYNSSFVVSYFCVVWRQFSFESFLFPSSFLLHFLLFTCFACAVYEFRNQKLGPNCLYVCVFWFLNKPNWAHWTLNTINDLFFPIAHCTYSFSVGFYRFS